MKLVDLTEIHTELVKSWNRLEIHFQNRYVTCTRVQCSDQTQCSGIIRYNDSIITQTSIVEFTFHWTNSKYYDGKWDDDYYRFNVSTATANE